MTLTGGDFTPLCADLDAALGELASAAERAPDLWTRGRPGKWTAGQHVAHVGVSMTVMADAFEVAEPALRAGSLPPPPPRGFLQSLFVRFVVEQGHMPMGGKAVTASLPPDRPERDATLGALRRDAGRLRALGERLSPAECHRLWISNPFRTSWHYRLPESVRVHAVHARHHAKMIGEIGPEG